MPDTATLPKPLKRRGFTPREVAAVFIKYEARCAKCREKVSLGNYQIDHIHRLDALGKHELENWQLLCVPCHKPKTANDNREAKKGRRIRGELKPRVKKQIQSRGFSDRDPQLIPTRESRAPDGLGFSKWKKPKNYVSPLSKEHRRKVKERVEGQ